MERHKQEIREFILRAFKGERLRDDEDIFESGFVNSLFAMELVTFVESKYGITVENEDLELENFSSVDNLAAFVDVKSSQSDKAAS